VYSDLYLLIFIYIDFSLFLVAYHIRLVIVCIIEIRTELLRQSGFCSRVQLTHPHSGEILLCTPEIVDVGVEQGFNGFQID
jgi:hypothetical protein